MEMIRSNPGNKEIPIIFLTGKNDRASVEKVLELKPNGYLLKSLGRPEVLGKVKDFFEKRR